MKSDDSSKVQRATESGRGKKSYRKPAFRHEQVFETMALACGKISATQATCRTNRRNS